MNELRSFDPRAERLRQVGDVIQAVAVHHSRVDIDDTTHQRWCQIMGLMRELDTVSDSGQLSTEQSMAYLTQPTSPFYARYPDLFPDQIEPEAHQAMLDRARNILELGRFVASTNEVQDYLRYRTLEAEQAANLLYDSATGYVRDQPAFTRSFMPLARSCAISANFYDSFVDGHRDYIHGQVRLRPNLQFYLRVGTLSVKHFLPVPRVILHPAVIKAFGPMALHGIGNKLRFDADGNPVGPRQLSR